MRRTAQRTMVYNAIVRLGGHCTADEIAAELHRAKPGFPRSTVYRALDALTASGSVYAAHLGEGPTHYELEAHLENLHHFQPVRTEVLVVGVCDTCSRTPGRKAGRQASRRPTLEHVHVTKGPAQAP
jgi:Fe2+ or Zn2+ uptake regulation protein